MNEPQICYLAEGSDISQNGNLKGKTLRCYEVTLEFQTNKHGYTRATPIPTGTMYTLKNNKLVKSASKATLTDKYLISSNIRTTVDSHSSWSSCLYATPTLAIGAKLMTIHKQRAALKEEAAKLIAKLNSYQPYSDSLQIMIDENPELFI